MVSQSVAAGMQVEQAVFASSDRGNVKGYQLIARSPGVDSTADLELTRWSPTKLPSDASDRGIISSWSLQDGRVVVARTVYGGPEYSNRGGTQVVTLFLLLRRDQMESYNFDPIAVARTAVAIGHLKLPLDMRCQRLASVALPDQPLFRPLSERQNRRKLPAQDALIDEAANLLRASQRVAVIGFADRVDAVELLISKLSSEQRTNFSFTTGLSPSIRRPVQAHFYRYPNAFRRRALETQGVAFLTAVPQTR